MLAKYSYGYEAVAYLESQLLQGSTLSKKVFDFKNLFHARKFSFLPANISFEESVMFQGGVFSGTLIQPGVERKGGKESQILIKENLFELVEALDNPYLIHDDWLSSLDDIEYLNKNGEEFIIYEKEIVSYIQKDKFLSDKIPKFQTNSHYPSISMISNLPKDFNLQSNNQISNSDLGIIAEGVKVIIIGAYDMETYIIASWI